MGMLLGLKYVVDVEWIEFPNWLTFEERKRLGYFQIVSSIKDT